MSTVGYDRPDTLPLRAMLSEGAGLSAEQTKHVRHYTAKEGDKLRRQLSNFRAEALTSCAGIDAQKEIYRRRARSICSRTFKGQVKVRAVKSHAVSSKLAQVTDEGDADAALRPHSASATSAGRSGASSTSLRTAITTPSTTTDNSGDTTHGKLLRRASAEQLSLSQVANFLNPDWTPGPKAVVRVRRPRVVRVVRGSVVLAGDRLEAPAGGRPRTRSHSLTSAEEPPRSRSARVRALRHSFTDDSCFPEDGEETHNSPVYISHVPLNDVKHGDDDVFIRGDFRSKNFRSASCALPEIRITAPEVRSSDRRNDACAWATHLRSSLRCADSDRGERNLSVTFAGYSEEIIVPRHLTGRRCSDGSDATSRSSYDDSVPSEQVKEVTTMKIIYRKQARPRRGITATLTHTYNIER